MPSFWQFVDDDEYSKTLADTLVSKYRIPKVQTPAPMGGELLPAAPPAAGSPVSSFLQQVGYGGEQPQSIPSASQPLPMPSWAEQSPMMPTPIPLKGANAWESFINLINVPSQAVGVPLLGALTAGLTPGRQITATDPKQLYNQWRYIEQQRKPLFKFNVGPIEINEKWLSEQVLADPLFWLNFGAPAALKAARAADAMGDAAKAARLVQLAKTANALDVATSPFAWPGMVGRGLTTAARGAAGAIAPEALGPATRWISEALEKAGPVAREATEAAGRGLQLGGLAVTAPTRLSMVPISALTGVLGRQTGEGVAGAALRGVASGLGLGELAQGLYLDRLAQSRLGQRAGQAMREAASQPMGVVEPSAARLWSLADKDELAGLAKRMPKPKKVVVASYNGVVGWSDNLFWETGDPPALKSWAALPTSTHGADLSERPFRDLGPGRPATPLGVLDAEDFPGKIVPVASEDGMIVFIQGQYYGHLLKNHAPIELRTHERYQDPVQVLSQGQTVGFVMPVAVPAAGDIINSFTAKFGIKLQQDEGQVWRVAQPGGEPAAEPTKAAPSTPPFEQPAQAPRRGATEVGEATGAGSPPAVPDRVRVPRSSDPLAESPAIQPDGSRVPGRFLQGDRVVLADGRHGTITHESKTTISSGHYIPGREAGTPVLKTEYHYSVKTDNGVERTYISPDKIVLETEPLSGEVVPDIALRNEFLEPQMVVHRLNLAREYLSDAKGRLRRARVAASKTAHQKDVARYTRQVADFENLLKDWVSRYPEEATRLGIQAPDAARAATESAGVSKTHAYTLVEKNDRGSVEISFAEKPDRAVLDALKAKGFRWSNATRTWYRPVTMEQSRARYVEEAKAILAPLAPAAPIEQPVTRPPEEAPQTMEVAGGVPIGRVERPSMLTEQQRVFWETPIRSGDNIAQIPGITEAERSLIWGLAANGELSLRALSEAKVSDHVRRQITDLYRIIQRAIAEGKPVPNSVLRQWTYFKDKAAPETPMPSQEQALIERNRLQPPDQAPRQMPTNEELIGAARDIHYLLAQSGEMAHPWAIAEVLVKRYGIARNYAEEYGRVPGQFRDWRGKTWDPSDGRPEPRMEDYPEIAQRQTLGPTIQQEEAPEPAVYLPRPSDAELAGIARDLRYLLISKGRENYASAKFDRYFQETYNMTKPESQRLYGQSSPFRDIDAQGNWIATDRPEPTYAQYPELRLHWNEMLADRLRGLPDSERILEQAANGTLALADLDSLTGRSIVKDEVRTHFNAIRSALTRRLPVPREVRNEFAELRVRSQEGVDVRPAEPPPSPEAPGTRVSERGPRPSGEPSTRASGVLEGTQPDTVPPTAEIKVAGAEEQGARAGGARYSEGIREPGVRPGLSGDDGEAGSDVPDLEGHPKPSRPRAPIGVAQDLNETADEVTHRVSRANTDSAKIDYMIRETDDLAAGGAKTKFRNNIDAIKLVKKLQEEGRWATAEEQAILARFTGWGNTEFGTAWGKFHSPSRPGAWDSLKAIAEDRGWGDEYSQIREILTPEEYEAASRSRLNAHYTDPDVVRVTWDTIMESLGFDNIAHPRVLEPAGGIGYFFGLMPPKLARDSIRTAVELDTISGAIFRQLYQNADVHIRGFEDLRLPKESQDLVVSNVPFGQISMHVTEWAEDRSLKWLNNLSIHNQYFARALEYTRPGGLIAFITSRFTMDNPEMDVLRAHIAARADFLGAVRLPRTAFKAIAGTEVVTDVIFLRKLAFGEVPGAQSWVKTRNVKVMPDGSFKIVVPTGRNQKKQLAGTIPINEYYLDNPDAIVGMSSMGGSMYRTDEPQYTVEPLEGDLSLKEQLSMAMKSFVSSKQGRQGESEGITDLSSQGMLAPEGLKPGGLIDVDGKIMYREGYSLVPAKLNKNHPDSDADKIRGMLTIRDAARAVTAAQIENKGDAAWKKAVSHLNEVYDNFVLQNGPLNGKYNRGLMRKDPDGFYLRALERWSKDTEESFFETYYTKKGKNVGIPQRRAKKVTLEDANRLKEQIFSKKTVSGPVAVDRVDSAQDGLLVTLNETGKIDLDRIAKLSQTTPAEVRESLRGVVYDDPNAGVPILAEEYLSGDVKAKLVAARALAAEDPRYQENVDALEKVQPEDIPPSKIFSWPGATWVPDDDMSAFVNDLIGSEDAQVSYFSKISEWRWIRTPSSWSRARSVETFGTKRMSAIELVDKLMNHKTIQIWDPPVKDGDPPIYNEEQTILANEKAKQIVEEFRQWLWTDPERGTRLHRVYNDSFNRHVPRQYDGSFLTLPGKNPNITLMPHQLSAISRALRGNNVMLAHEVGSGKTFVMIAAGMESRRLGLSRKNLYIVPNHLVAQTAKEFMLLYPNANLLVPTKDDYSAANRNTLMSRIATSDWDGIILPLSQATMIPMHPDVYERYMSEEIQNLRLALQEMIEAGADDRTQKQMEAEIAKEEEKLKKKVADLRENQDNTIFFNELGIDAIFADEADVYKNLGFATHMNRIKGLSKTHAQRSFDMLMKTREVAKRNGGRGIVFATGTPVANSISELWTMMRYLMPDSLEKLGIDRFDSWAANFATIGARLEMTVKGTVEMVDRFATFTNLPELSHIWQQVADIRLSEDLPEIQAKKPRLLEGKRQPVVVKATDWMRNFIKGLVTRSEQLSWETRHEDNMLKIYTDAKKAALDPRLVDPTHPDDPGSKLRLLAGNVIRLYKEEEALKGTQLIFSDLGTPKKKEDIEQMRQELEIALEEAGARVSSEDDYDIAEGPDVETDLADELYLRDSIYAEIKRLLATGGIPEEEIALIHDAKTAEQKIQLFDNMNNGKVRVLIGSTEKMGAGMNAQKRLRALHHLDTPWRPRDIEQREGRILRQGNDVYGPKFDADGNLVDEGLGVEIFQYLSEGSFDGVLWEQLESKWRAVKAAMNRNPTERVVAVGEDADIMSAAEMKAFASGNRLVFDQAQKRNEIAKLGALKAGWTDTQRAAKDKLLELPRTLSELRTRLASQQNHQKFFNEHKELELIVGNETATDRKGAGAALEAWYAAHREDMVRTGNSFLVGTYRGWTLKATSFNHGMIDEADPTKKMWTSLHFSLQAPDGSFPSYSASTIDPDSTSSGLGWLMRMDNALGGIDKDVSHYTARIAQLEKELVRYKEMVGKPFDREQDLADLHAQLSAIEIALRQGKTELPELDQIRAGGRKPTAGEPITDEMIAEMAIRLGQGETEEVPGDELSGLAGSPAEAPPIGRPAEQPDEGARLEPFDEERAKVDREYRDAEILANDDYRLGQGYILPWERGGDEWPELNAEGQSFLDRIIRDKIAKGQAPEGWRVENDRVIDPDGKYVSPIAPAPAEVAPEYGPLGSSTGKPMAQWTPEEWAQYEEAAPPEVAGRPGPARPPEEAPIEAEAPPQPMEQPRPVEQPPIEPPIRAPEEVVAPPAEPQPIEVAPPGEVAPEAVAPQPEAGIAPIGERPQRFTPIVDVQNSWSGINAILLSSGGDPQEDLIDIVEMGGEGRTFTFSRGQWPGDEQEQLRFIQRRKPGWARAEDFVNIVEALFRKEQRLPQAGQAELDLTGRAELPQPQAQPPEEAPPPIAPESPQPPMEVVAPPEQPIEQPRPALPEVEPVSAMGEAEGIPPSSSVPGLGIQAPESGAPGAALPPPVRRPIGRTIQGEQPTRRPIGRTIQGEQPTRRPIQPTIQGLPPPTEAGPAAPPPGEQPPIGPPPSGPGAPPPAAPTPPTMAPRPGSTLPAVRPTLDLLRELYQGDWWRRIGDNAQDRHPTLARIMSLVGSPSNHPTGAAIVLRDTIIEDFKSAAVGAVARVRQYGDFDKLFDVIDGRAMVNGQRVALSDLLEEPTKYTLTNPQRTAIDNLHQVYEDLKDIIVSEGIDLHELEFGPGDHYVGRRVLGRLNASGELEIAKIYHDTKIKPGIPASFERERAFETQEEALQAGFRYLPPVEVLQANIQAAGRRIADKRFADLILQLIPSRTGQKAHFGEIALPMPETRGHYFEAKEIEPLLSYLNMTGPKRLKDAAELVGTVNSIPRMLMTTFDAGPLFIQLQMVGSYRPAVWAKAVQEGFKAFASEKNEQRFLATHGDTIARWAPYGASFVPTEFTQATQRGGLLGGHGALGRAAQPFGRIFDTMLNAAKIYGLEATEHIAKSEQDKRDLARFWNVITGTTSAARMGITDTQQAIESAMLFAPRYTRATLSLLTDVAHGGLRGNLARTALGKWGLAGLLLYLAACAALQQKPELDPRSGGRFLTLEIGGQHVGVGGSMYATTRTLAQMVMAPQDAPTYAARYLKSRLSPGASSAIEILTRKDYIGRPLDTPLELTEEIAKSNLLPIWVQSVLEAGNVPSEQFAAGAADIVGLRAYPVSPAEKRNDLRSQLAQQMYGKSWGQLTRAERYSLETYEPNLQRATQTAREASVEAKNEISLFWADVERQREPIQQEVQSLTQALRSGQISGNQYRDALQEREMLMAQIPRFLQRTERYKGIPLTQAERLAYYGGQVPEETTPVDTFIDAYYQISEQLRDPQTGTADPSEIVRLRKVLKRNTDPRVVTEAMQYINRNRDPLYVQALEDYQGYFDIPQYIGLSEEQAQKANRTGQILRDLARANPSLDPSVLRALYSRQDPEGLKLYLVSSSRRNPERRRYWAAHPLLSVFFSDLTGEELEMVVPGYGQMMQPSPLPMPSWA